MFCSAIEKPKVAAEMPRSTVIGRMNRPRLWRRPMHREMITPLRTMRSSMARRWLWLMAFKAISLPMIGCYLYWNYADCCNGCNSPSAPSAAAGIFEVALINLVGLRVLHDARHLGDEVLVVTGAAEKVEADLHPGGDAAAGDDAARVDHARTADSALRRDLGEAVDRHL